MKKKPKINIVPHSAAWRKEAIALAVSYSTAIYPCVHCAHPVREGYCCGYCGSDNPSGKNNDYNGYISLQEAFLP